MPSGQLLILVADNSYAVLELLSAVKEEVSFITRLRVDAALYDAAPAVRPAGKPGPHPLKGARQPTLQQRLQDAATQWQPLTIAQWYNEKDKQVLVATGIATWDHSGKPPVEIRWVLIKDAQQQERKREPTALLCTNTALSAAQIIAYFIQRWAVEVTLEESRLLHPGVESQRQWSDKAIARTTPILLGLFSIVALWADQLHHQQLLQVAHTAWYRKQQLTFADAIAAVRTCIYKEGNYYTSIQNNDMLNIPKSLFDQLTNLLTRAA